MLKIIDAGYLQDYKLLLHFNSGERLEINLEDCLDGNAFRPLWDKKVFAQYGLVNRTLEWVNGADFAPGFLYQLASKQSKIRLWFTMCDNELI